MDHNALPTRTVRWNTWDNTGLEHFSLHMNADSIQGEGVVIGARGGTPYGLHYRVTTDMQWRTREVWVRMVSGVYLHVFADGLGHWTDDKGNTMPNLDGCMDVDIAATPFTNTLPIRRLDMRVDHTAELAMAYVPLPSLQMCPDGQRYTRIADQRYLYESSDRDFSAELEVDEDGLVMDYPGLFHRIQPST